MSLDPSSSDRSDTANFLGASAAGDLPKWRANSETWWRCEAWVFGERLRTCMSKVMLCRRLVMEGSFSRWGRLRAAASILSQSELSGDARTAEQTGVTKTRTAPFGIAAKSTTTAKWLSPRKDMWRATCPHAAAIYVRKGRRSGESDFLGRHGRVSRSRQPDRASRHR
jgi:hypothetical protein